jgi:electron transport complex protein RnfD
MWKNIFIQDKLHSSTKLSVQQIMFFVLLAAVPGIITQFICFGWGAFLQLVWCMLLAVAFEAFILKLRNYKYTDYLPDNSALVTGMLLGVAIPPLAPWWFGLVGVGFAIVFGKHIYGGIGKNIFNPAMLGYALLLVSFPKQAATWLPASSTLLPQPSLTEAWGIFWGYAAVSADSFAHATPLDIIKNNNALTLNELWKSSQILDGIGGKGWVLVNISYAIGGLFLLYKKIIKWQAPLGMLLAIVIMAFFGWQGNNTSSAASPMFYLFDGATMLGAFFIITDPTSGATSNLGRLIFGIGVGILVYVIRVFGGYPDAVAFATLLMNITAPLLDYYTSPRAYGHKKADKGLPRTKS